MKHHLVICVYRNQNSWCGNEGYGSYWKQGWKTKSSGLNHNLRCRLLQDMKSNQLLNCCMIVNYINLVTSLNRLFLVANIFRTLMYKDSCDETRRDRSCHCCLLVNLARVHRFSEQPFSLIQTHVFDWSGSLVLKVAEFMNYSAKIEA